MRFAPEISWRSLYVAVVLFMVKNAFGGGVGGGVGGLADAGSAETGTG